MSKARGLADHSTRWPPRGKARKEHANNGLLLGGLRFHHGLFMGGVYADLKALHKDRRCHDLENRTTYGRSLTVARRKLHLKRGAPERLLRTSPQGPPLLAHGCLVAWGRALMPWIPAMPVGVGRPSARQGRLFSDMNHGVSVCYWQPESYAQIIF